MKLFLSLPTTGTLPAGFLNYVTGLMIGIECRLTINQSINTYNAIALDVSADNFLNSDCDVWLNIDADEVFEPWHVKRIISHNKDIVGGFYAKKQKGKPVYVCNALMDKPEAGKDGLMQVKRMGGGFLCVKRGVFEAMKGIAKMYRDPDSKREYKNFFPQGVVNEEYVTEDYYFCDNARSLGYKIYGDTHIKLGHVGSAVYPLE